MRGVMSGVRARPSMLRSVAGKSAVARASIDRHCAHLCMLLLLLQRIGVVIDSLNARLQALLKRGDGAREHDVGAASSPKAAGSNLEALIQALEEQMDSGAAASQAEIVRFQTEIVRLQETQAKLEENHRVELTELERESTKRLETALRDAELTIRRLSERLIHDHGRELRCLTTGCTEVVVRRIESNVPGGVSSPGVCVACITIAAAASSPEEGKLSASVQQAAYFCTNGHASYCDGCWEKQVRSTPHASESVDTQADRVAFFCSFAGESCVHRSTDDSSGFISCSIICTPFFTVRTCPRDDSDRGVDESTTAAVCRTGRRLHLHRPICSQTRV